MRNLTILRRKKAAAALGKMKVYIVEKKTKALDIPVLTHRDMHSYTKKSLI